MKSPSSSLPSRSSVKKSGAQLTIDLEDLVRIKADARGFSFLPRQPMNSLLAGRHSSRLRGRGLAFEELRHYHPGDDVRTMDWKATARLRTPHVRVYNEERERPVWLLVDQRRSMYFGSRCAMKSVVAAKVAALSAWRALAGGDRVGGIVFNNQEMVELSPHRSQARVLRLFHEVVRLNQALSEPVPEDSGSISLNQVLAAAVRQAKHDSLLVLISDLDGADDETQRLASALASHNDMLVLATYDPLGASLQGQSGMMAMDRGQTFSIPSGSSFSSSFQQAFARKLGRWTELFRSLRIPVIPLSTALSPVDQLRDRFGVHHARKSSL